MKDIVKLIQAGFESSSGTTPEFKSFCRKFTNRFKKELESAGATDIQIKAGHFYLSGFYTVKGQAWYFSLTDVRGGGDSIMYRTARDYKDFTGGSNHWEKMAPGMAKRMHP